ncbi:MAG: family 43 glycosylhydrolase, partial [Bacteroidaceae bacterium]|nr:family 43 glycosylhydrolase [Bacteroidaceae bacterium]
MYRKLIAAILVLTMTASAVAQEKYTNPVYNADFPDPSVQRAPDGWLYAYATGPNCLKSKDLVHWHRVSRVIDRPTWNDTIRVDSDGKEKNVRYSFWACDVRRVKDKYIMYYACALWGNITRTGIGVATG